MKEFKTYEQQIELLKSRSLIISDKEFALKKLQEDNYYNIINGYKDLFLNPSDQNNFITGTTFEEIYSLYQFDRDIKGILLKNILKVENILRTLISYCFSEKYGNDNYLKLDSFETLKLSGCSKKKYQQRIEQIQKLICALQSDIAKNINKKSYINHYILNYGFVPLWVLVNAISLGRLSQFYSLMDQAVRIKVAKHWNIMENELNQHIKTLAFYRNLCAHDERIYNSYINQAIPDTDYHKILQIPKNNNNYVCGKRDVFSLIISLKILLPSENFNTMCNQIEGRMISLSKRIQIIDTNLIYTKMGFPSSWIAIKKS